MLSTLAITNLALIESLEIEFTGGLNIVTGETGAGKSVIIGALQLVLGGRADRSLIRSGAESCDVCAVYELAAKPRLLADVNTILADSGITECDDGQLIIKRIFTAKTARNFVNSTPTNLTVLRALGELLVDVHGPYDHQSLLKSEKQLTVLDHFAGTTAVVEQCGHAFRQLQAHRRRLDEWERNSPSPVQIESMRHQLDEIRKAQLSVEEAEQLAARHAVAANSTQILHNLHYCRQRLADQDESVLDMLADTLRHIQELERMSADTGRPLFDALESIITDVQDLTEQLHAAAGGVECDPSELRYLDERIEQIHRLRRKYGHTIDKVLAYADELEADLERLENYDDYRDELLESVNAAEAEASDHARKLSLRRHSAAPTLARSITDKLRVLGFESCDFSIHLTPNSLSSTGCDLVEFAFSPNPGEGEHHLRAIASSGEIARVMLAIKAVLADADQIPVFVFDEIDANIGGTTATQVGRELVALGKEHQTICITHLAQVAAGASRHFRVLKRTCEGRTIATMDVLSADERIEEIARMLGGQHSTSVVLRHAAELIENAT